MMFCVIFFFSSPVGLYDLSVSYFVNEEKLQVYCTFTCSLSFLNLLDLALG